MALDGFDEGALLRLAASLEKASEHPLAEAIVKGAEARGVTASGAGRLRGDSGPGHQRSRRGQDNRARHGALDAEPRHRRVRCAGAHLEALRRDGKIALLAAIDGKLAGWLAMADPVKPSAREALAALRRRGIDVIMATGDNRTTAEAVARELGIATVHADVLPEDKARIMAELKAAGRKVAMAGDGINDAPALAAADVGIAMGTGADVAIESAGLTLLKGDLAGIVRARRLAEATVANIWQNLAFAFGYNALGIPVAAGVLYPVFGVLLSPMIAAAAMSLSSVSVVGNALAPRHDQAFGRLDLRLAVREGRQRCGDERMRRRRHAVRLGQPRHRARQTGHLDRLAGQQVVAHGGHHRRSEARRSA